MEFPSLLDNPKVTSINGIEKKIIKDYLEENLWSEEARVRIDKDLADALLRNSPFARPQSTPPPIISGPQGEQLSVEDIRANPKQHLAALTEVDPTISKNIKMAGTTGNLHDAEVLFLENFQLPGGIV